MRNFLKTSFCAVFLLFTFCSTFSCAKKMYSHAKKKILQTEDMAAEESFTEREYYAPTALSENKEYTNKESNKVDAMERKLIKNGNINFESSDIKASRTFIENLAVKYNAYVSSEDENSSKKMLEQNLTIRIPKDAFDSFVAELLDGVKQVSSKNIYIEDVTEEFIDINARLNVKKDAEQTYLRLLEHAKTVSDVLDIQEQIEKIRSDIESIEGRLKYLEKSINYSTLNIRIYQFITPISNFKPISFARRVASSLKDGVSIFAEALLGLLSAWVFIVIALVIILIAKRKNVFSKNRKKEEEKNEHNRIRRIDEE